MSAIPSSLPAVQDALEYMRENLTIDQKTQDKAYAVALVIIKTIAIAAASVAVLSLANVSNIAKFLPGTAVFATFVGICLFSKPNSNPTPYYRPCDEEWRKEAKADREAEALKNTTHQSKMAETSKAWHNGNDSNFVAVGTRKA